VLKALASDLRLNTKFVCFDEYRVRGRRPMDGDTGGQRQVASQVASLL
jgi:hypothetical protein